MSIEMSLAIHAKVDELNALGLEFTTEVRAGYLAIICGNSTWVYRW